MKTRLLILLLSILFVVPCLAGKIDAKAEFELAVKYESGRGVKKDFTKALEHYRSAATAGYAPAQSTLGYMYLYGEGVPRDFNQALEWNQKAADSGDPYGQLNLGVMYDEGRGAPQDKEKANDWYRKAANQGDARAQLNLGVNYWRGEGVPRNYNKAYRLLTHVRMTAREPKARWRARAALDQLAPLMTKEEIKKAMAQHTDPI